MSETNITITPAPGTWVVRVGGAVLGESDRALELREPGRQPVICFPREDIEMAFMDTSDRRETTPGKGEVSFYSIVSKSYTIPDGAWAFENPAGEFSRLRDHLAFAPSDRITVEQL